MTAVTSRDASRSEYPSDSGRSTAPVIESRHESGSSRGGLSLSHDTTGNREPYRRAAS